MKWQILAAVALTGVTVMGGCENTQVQRVDVPAANDPSAYRPMVQPKQLPPEGYYGQGAPGQGQGAAPTGGSQLGNPSIQNEDLFVAAYQKRSPRIMVFVNRTIQGDSVPKDTFEKLVNGQTANEAVGVASTDYEMIEAAIVQYFGNSPKVRVQDSDAARAKLTREQVLRIENSDPAANRLLAVELQQDVLIRVTASPTRQASSGQPSVRLIAKAVSTTDARNLGNAFIDMPLPMGKSNINMYTRYLSEQLMGQMAQKWAQPAEYDPIEVRVYKAATLDDSLKIRQWMVRAPGVTKVDTVTGTAASATSYAVFQVGFGGAPEDFYAELKDGIGMSSGLKAVDLTKNTITLEVTGPMNLVTTTRHVESTTTVETRTTEERRVEPINPAPGGQR